MSPRRYVRSGRNGCGDPGARSMMAPLEGLCLLHSGGATSMLFLSGPDRPNRRLLPPELAL
jgi:hypothetical protein